MIDRRELLRKLPSVDILLRTERAQKWLRAYRRDLVVWALRRGLDDLRRRILDGQAEPTLEASLKAATHWLEAVYQPSLRPVINATGVVLHTNLGRSPLSQDVLTAMREVGRGYSNLEYDLEQGRRGSRYVHAEKLLCQLTGAEAALVVNNNAGAVLLVLTALAHDREVIISRSQLIEIGGGFRIPDVMAASGARLVEVGTTNRTYLSDYETAITDMTAALMRAHWSNYRIIGFVEQPALPDLCQLAHSHGLLIFDDLGSGTLLDTAAFGLPHEPSVQESVQAGVDLVTFSGDKLLGGPQAGLVVGRASLIAELKRHPLTRALRVDKTTLAGVQANLLHYVRGEATEKIPIWRMIAEPEEHIRQRAVRLRDCLGEVGQMCELWEGRSMIGGGSLPEVSLPTVLLVLPQGDETRIARSLREGEPSVVARIQQGRVVLDLRTVLAEQEEVLVERLQQVL